MHCPLYLCSSVCNNVSLTQVVRGSCEYRVQPFVCVSFLLVYIVHLDRVKRIWYLSPVRVAKVRASLRIRAVSPEPSLLAHTSSESKGTFRQKARSLAPLNSWACAVEICHDGMLEDTNSLDGAHFVINPNLSLFLVSKQPGYLRVSSVS